MKILVCSDGSAAAENAVSLGALIAGACNAPVTLLGVVEKPGESDPILDALRRALRSLEEKKVPAELVTITGEPIAEIIKRTTEHRFDLVLIGGARKSLRGVFWLSSKVYKIITGIHAPVLVSLAKSSGLSRILVCTGGRRHTGRAVAFTAQLAHCMGASVTLLHVMPSAPPFFAGIYREETDVQRVLNSNSELGRSLREHKRVFETAGVPVSIALRQGSVVSEIQTEIADGNYDLVVTGSSLNRSAVRSYVLGDITREIVNRAACAVMVVRSGLSAQGILQRLSGMLERVRHKENSGAQTKP